MRLIDAPVGVFCFDNELVLKTEYSKKYGSVYCPECYILSSGERFWGGMETIEDFETKYNYLEVEPVNVNIKSGQESTIQFEPHYDEWCHSCKEYDKEKHSCPQFNRVIKSTIEELKTIQPEPCEDAVSRETLTNFIKNASVWVTYKKGDSEDEAEFVENIIKQTKQAIINMIKLDLPSVTPKQAETESANANEKCGYKPDCPWSYGGICSSPNDHSYNECDYDRGIFPDGYEPKSKTQEEGDAE